MFEKYQSDMVWLYEVGIKKLFTVLANQIL